MSIPVILVKLPVFIDRISYPTTKTCLLLELLLLFYKKSLKNAFEGKKVVPGGTFSCVLST